MNSKLNLASGILILLTASIPANAEVSANAAVVSNYVFRGITQTNDDPTVQGGVDYDSGSGFSLGAWGSGVDEGFEVDLYGAYNYKMDNGLGFGAGLLQYEYTDDQFSDSITEIYIQGSYKILGVSYYDGSVDDTNNTEYSYLNVSADFEYDQHGFGVFWGNTDYDNGSDFDDSGVYYKMDLNGLELKATYTDSDMVNDTTFFVTIGSSWEL